MSADTGSNRDCKLSMKASIEAQQQQSDPFPSSSSSAPSFESPFLSLSPVLRAMQLLGIFNFSIAEGCSEFAYKPFRILYSLSLNALFVMLWVGFNLFLFSASDVTLTELRVRVTSIFSITDFVALGGVAILLQGASLGLHVSNTDLGNDLNDLVSKVRRLGVIKLDNFDIRNGESYNPRTTKLFGGLGAVIFLLLTSNFMVGFHFPYMIGISRSPWINFLLGLSQAIAVTYLHLPKILCETFFLRLVHVLEYRYQNLLEHLDCRLIEKGSYDADRSKTSSCIEHWMSLIQLFRSVEKTFRKQLVLQHAIIMGSLISGIYLTISFLITSSSNRDCPHMLFTFGFLLYSVVPTFRLFVTAASVDKVMVKIELTRLHLYEMEAYVTSPEHLVQVRWAIRQYHGIDGFSACNYFTVNSQLVTSIMGYLTTYIIVLMQFKVTDLKLQ